MSGCTLAGQRMESSRVNGFGIPTISWNNHLPRLKERVSPNEADYTIDPNTYHGDDEFFQDEGLEGTFEIDLTEMFEMEVDNEDAADEVHDPDDLRELE